MAGPIHLLACGLCSPLGLERRSTLLELAAGADVFAETDVLDERGQPIRACRLDLLPASASRTERMASLATLAIEELLQLVRVLGLAGPLPIMLALPEDDGGGRWQVEPIWAALLERASALGLVLEPLRNLAELPDGTRRSGAAGVFQLLTIAEALLDAGRDPLVIGAVDSRCDPASLTELARGRRLIDGGTEGYLPGEGAGFLLVTRQVPSLQTLARPFSIVAHTHDLEPRSFKQPEPSDAIGLTRALRRLRIGPPAISRVERALSCQWDAGYWGRELVFAYLRNAELFPEPLRVDLVAERLGNPGAAAPMLLLGQALDVALRGAKQTEQQTRVLVYGCAEAGPLGGCVVEAGPHSGLLELPIVASTSPEQLAFEADRLADHLEQVGSLLVARFDDLRRSIYPWPELRELERRLGDRVWVAAERGRRLGPAVADLLDHDDPDVVRACAYLLVAAGSVDQHEQALARMRGFADDEDELPLWRSGIAHALYGRDAGSLVGLLDGAEPALAVAVLDMLDELGHRPPELAVALLDDPERDPEVRLRALALLANNGPAVALARVDAAWRAAPEDPRLVELMLALGRHDVLDQLRLALVQGRALSAAIYEVWSLAASSRDAFAFAQLAERDTLEPLQVWALSSFGSVTAVPALLAALEHPTLAMDAAIALERILGAGMIASVWIPDADAVNPEREGESRLQVIVDPQRWREVWAACSSRFDPGARYRHGRLLDHRVRVDELARSDALLCMREQALRELRAGSGTPLYIGLSWPIFAQQQAIERLRSWLGAG